MNTKFDVTNDLIFQNIFGKVGNERITKGLLEKILGIEIDEREITLDTNKRLIGKEYDDKIGRVDVKAKLKDGTKISIEMQVANYSYIVKRILYYWSQLYIQDLKRGNDYSNLRKTINILISVNGIPGLEEIEEYHTVWQLREKRHKEKILLDDIEIHIIELNKFKEGKGNPEDNWIRFIKGEKMNESKLEKELKEAMEELKRLEGNPEMKEEYEALFYDIVEKNSMMKAERELGIKERRGETEE